MTETAAQYRRWVLNHWRSFGWSQPVDRLTTAKGQKAIGHLVKTGMLEADGYGMFRITDAGRAVLAELQP